ncbi:hypothetical protein [Lutibacter sp.]|uniref:hypothetical protein n=1 Tax=Lutibacter sp. TaxID=1925666 RepID=UPI002732BBEA|nr:hypothetical protein [Lutibacter sp.]MDP3314041.1 hypothetical protein [Lutibacter sp.]
MNNAHLHLLLNHLSITFVIIGFIVMLFGFLFKSDIAKRIAYLIFILAALFGFVTFQTGEGSKPLIEGIKGVNKISIITHEKTALIFLFFLYLLGAFSIVGLWANWKKKSFSNLLGYSIMVYLFVVFYYAIQAGTTGGEIRHLEIIPLVENSDV